MSLKSEASTMLPVVEMELQRQISRLHTPQTSEFHEMLAYHMGWRSRGVRGPTRGKRIRPLVLLLACASCGGRWQNAVPAAAAIEIAHNFSLIHDDIQDNSPTRRGRPALWTKYGAALAINAGDALFTLANLAILDLQKSFQPEHVTAAAAVLEGACLDLTRGQFLDLHQQNGSVPSLRDYWLMVEGKTAALLSASAQLGALLAGARKSISERYRIFGRLLGLAFQIQDDILGIWGNEALTGKSSASDLQERKLSLPVVYGLRQKGQFARSWNAAKARAASTSVLRQLLEDEGARAYAVRHGKRRTDEALQTLGALKPQGNAGAALVELTRQLLARQS
jgi:geranylgeranyl diphosphate synthase type I